MTFGAAVDVVVTEYTRSSRTCVVGSRQRRLAAENSLLWLLLTPQLHPCDSRDSFCGGIEAVSLQMTLLHQALIRKSHRLASLEVSSFQYLL